MRKIFAAVLSVGLLVSATPSIAAPCKDAKGKFTKCPPSAPVKAVRCKAANGKFAKCGTPGAKPV
ncbi:hypothetical protein [Sphingomonas sp. Leaf339]|uniref:hypothetical protein n=1 Tax=Sphingomonas sp. Leaf339 TaxID=1736343 RepID=UPI0006FD5ABA|nr:hypothetical protein [Sphingomonas sp. Leaf339]